MTAATLEDRDLRTHFFTRAGRVRAVVEVERPISGRAAADPDLLAIEARLWAMIRDDAAAAERERVDA